MILKIRENFKNHINQIATIRIDFRLNPYLKKKKIYYYMQIMNQGEENNKKKNLIMNQEEENLSYRIRWDD